MDFFKNIHENKIEDAIRALKYLARCSDEEKKEENVFIMQINGSREMVTSLKKIARAYNPKNIEEIQWVNDELLTHLFYFKSFPLTISFFFISPSNTSKLVSSASI